MSLRPVLCVKLFIALLVAANVLFYGTVFLYPPAAAAVLAFVGRGPDAPLCEVAGAYRRHYSHGELEKRFAKESLVLEADPSGFQLVQTPKGRFWEASTHGSGIPSQLAELVTKYSQPLEAPIHAGDVVLDCGANVGVFTREALSLGARLVVAVEPAPENIQCLRRTFAGEIASGRVIIYEKGVWDKDDFLRLGRHDSSPAEDSFVRREQTTEGALVPLTTIDKMVDELKLDTVNFIKMDIEGAEQRALRGARKTLSKYRPRLEISVNHLPEDPERVPQIVKQARADYRVKLLWCAVRKDLRVIPEILYFY